MTRSNVGPVLLAASLLVAASCAREAPATRYDLRGQVIAVDADAHTLTVRHEDIPGFMPAMTMTYPVAPATLLNGLTSGDLVTGTLEVRDAQGRLVALTSTGRAPLPATANEVALASQPLGAGDEMPDAALIDSTDHRRSLAEWRGTSTLVTFIYTSCPLPTFCPLMDQNFATLQEALSEDAQLQGKVKLISISIDPERDTPAVLASHAAKRGANPAVWTFLTGDRLTVDRLAGRFGVSIVRADGTTEIAHTLRTVLVGPDGLIRVVYNGSSWTPSTVLADLRNVVKPS